MRTDFSDNALIQRCIEFSLLAIEYVEQLERERKFVIARQLLKSATSIGANSMEAQSAESKADFIHKLKIADKEAHETLYWLILCEQSQTYPFDPSLKAKLSEILRLLNAIILSAKRN
jgi:four helix bundle protein